MTSKEASRGKRRQEKSRNAPRRRPRLKRRLRRLERRTDFAGSRRRGSSTRRASAAIVLLVLAGFLVGVERADDLPDQMMTNHVALGEVDELDALHVVQDGLDLD